jgi:hypothetical protein
MYKHQSPQPGKSIDNWDIPSDDPRWVRISLDWEHSVGSQQFGAHFACLQAAVRPGFPLYDGLE